MLAIILKFNLLLFNKLNFKNKISIMEVLGTGNRHVRVQYCGG